MENKRICEHCLKPLVKIGTDRKGVNHGTDYPSRKYHKSCYKKVKHEYDAWYIQYKLNNIAEFNKLVGYG